ncbi:hypothetical protein [Streptomyces sp. NPDC001450]
MARRPHKHKIFAEGAGPGQGRLAVAVEALRTELLRQQLDQTIHELVDNHEAGAG